MTARRKVFSMGKSWAGTPGWGSCVMLQVCSLTWVPGPVTGLCRKCGWTLQETAFGHPSPAGGRLGPAERGEELSAWGPLGLGPEG